MKLILLSTPTDWTAEQDILCSLFECGLQRFHLRKPAFTYEEGQAWLKRLPKTFHPRIVLHQHWELIEEWELGGIHIPEWRRQQLSNTEKRDWQVRLAKKSMSLSTSVHDMQTLNELRQLSYVFLSPVFPSISKQGYAPTEEFRIQKEFPFEIYALGGIDAHKLVEVKDRGFDGAALLGAIWQEPASAVQKFRQVHKILHSFPMLLNPPV
ncbi:MAG: thiamine phosphate synthase [Bacteroidota bacterium]